LHHTTELDRNYVESVYDSYSTKVKKDKDDEDNDEAKAEDEKSRIITKGNAILAYEEVFKMWKVDLSLL